METAPPTRIVIMSRFKNKVFSESTLPVSREVPQEKKDDDKEINKGGFATEISILGKPEDISVNINHSSGVETEGEDVSDDHHEDDQGDPENDLGDPKAIKWKKRQQWDKSIEFLFSCISMSVGLGNQNILFWKSIIVFIQELRDSEKMKFQTLFIKRGAKGDNFMKHLCTPLVIIWLFLDITSRKPTKANHNFIFCIRFKKDKAVGVFINCMKTSYI